MMIHTYAHQGTLAGINIFYSSSDAMQGKPGYVRPILAYILLSLVSHVSYSNTLHTRPIRLGVRNLFSRSRFILVVFVIYLQPLAGVRNALRWSLVSPAHAVIPLKSEFGKHENQQDRKDGEPRDPRVEHHAAPPALALGEAA